MHRQSREGRHHDLETGYREALSIREPLGSRLGTSVTEAITPNAPERVAFPSMLQTWSEVSFLHWRVEPAEIRPLVPRSLDVDTFDGSAWVGLVPFRMRMRMPVGGLPIPTLSRYPETNVRTYVVDPSGRRGLWFFSLDVPRVHAIILARIAFGLPYAWSEMSLEERGSRIEYTARRRRPQGGLRSSVIVTTGVAQQRVVDPLALFLTARYRLYASGPLGLYSISVEHQPWSLEEITVDEIDDALVPSSGIRISGTPDHACASPGVGVRVGWPAAVGGSSRGGVPSRGGDPFLLK